MASLQLKSWRLVFSLYGLSCFIGNEMLLLSNAVNVTLQFLSTSNFLFQDSLRLPVLLVMHQGIMQHHLGMEVSLRFNLRDYTLAHRVSH